MTKKAKMVIVHPVQKGLIPVVYTVDGVNWINHGLYKKPETAREQRKILLEVGAVDNRVNSIFN